MSSMYCGVAPCVHAFVSTLSSNLALFYGARGPAEHCRFYLRQLLQCSNSIASFNMGCRNSNLTVVSNPAEAPEAKNGAPFIMVGPGDMERDINFLKTNGYQKVQNGPVEDEKEKPAKESTASLLRVKKGIVTSPYAQYRKPIPNLSAWKFLKGHIDKVLEREGNDYEWLVRKSRVDATTKSVIKYSELEFMTRKLASGFHRLGLQAHEEVLLVTTNAFEVFPIVLALWRLNVAVKIASPEDNSEILLRRMTESNVKYVVCDEGTSKTLQEAQRKNPSPPTVWSLGSVSMKDATDILPLMQDDALDFPGDLQDFNLDVNNDVIFMPFTSGTTGTSKAVLHTHKTLVACLMQGSFIRNTKSRHIMMPLRIYHLSGMLWALVSLIQGKTCIVIETVSTLGILEAIQEYEPGSLCGFPSFLVTLAQKLAENGNVCRSITSVLTTGETINNAGMKSLKVSFPNLRFVDVAFVMAELLHVTSTIPFSDTESQNDPTAAVAKDSKVGLLCCYSSAKVVDPETGEILKQNESGELCFRTHSVMKGYADRSEAASKTLISGWVHTGDCGYYDDNGLIFVTGRLTEVFKCDGVYVSPYELEAILMDHSDVDACAVVGVPDDRSGHVACGVISRRFGANTSVNDIKTFVDEKVSEPQKLRGGVIFIDDLPKTKAGKISRPEVLRMVLNLNKMKTLKL